MHIINHRYAQVKGWRVYCSFCGGLTYKTPIKSRNIKEAISLIVEEHFSTNRMGGLDYETKMSGGIMEVRYHLRGQSFIRSYAYSFRNELFFVGDID